MAAPVVVLAACGCGTTHQAGPAPGSSEPCA